MSQLSLAFDSSLLIRDEQGRYLPATADQILAAVRKVINLKAQRGAAFTSPELALALALAETTDQAALPDGIDLSNEIKRRHRTLAGGGA